MVAVHMEGGSSTPLGALVGFLAAEQPAKGVQLVEADGEVIYQVKDMKVALSES